MKSDYVKIIVVAIVALGVITTIGYYLHNAGVI